MKCHHVLIPAMHHPFIINWPTHQPINQSINQFASSNTVAFPLMNIYTCAYRNISSSSALASACTIIKPIIMKPIIMKPVIPVIRTRGNTSNRSNQTALCSFISEADDRLRPESGSGSGSGSGPRPRMRVLSLCLCCDSFTS